jgi:hypothetical protein
MGGRGASVCAPRDAGRQHGRVKLEFESGLVRGKGMPQQVGPAYQRQIEKEAGQAGSESWARRREQLGRLGWATREKRKGEERREKREGKGAGLGQKREGRGRGKDRGLD